MNGLLALLLKFINIFVIFLSFAGKDTNNNGFGKLNSGKVVFVPKLNLELWDAAQIAWKLERAREFASTIPESILPYIHMGR